MDQDKRASNRHPVPGGLPGEVSVLAPIEVRDVSERGAQFDTAFPLILDSIHDLRLELEEAAIVVRGRVAHCSIADIGGDLVRYRAGIEFINLPSHAIQAIRTHMYRLEQRRAARAAATPPPPAI
jgi:hypothetical protein